MGRILTHLKTAASDPVVIRKPHLGPDFTGSESSIDEMIAVKVDVVPTSVDLKDTTRQFQRSLIERALVDNDGNWSASARSLGMHRRNFHHLAVRLGLK